MFNYRRFCLAITTVLTLGLVGASSVAAAGNDGTPLARRAATGTLTINITKASGTVWGKVLVKPINKTCTATNCKYKVKVGTKLTLTERPTNSTAWPFSNWKRNGKNDGTSATVKFKMAESDKVSAIYMLPGGTLTINITDSGELWGKVKVDPIGKTCDAETCTYKNVTLGQNLTLTQTPTDTSTWPFSGWTLNGTDKGKADTLQFSMDHTDTVDANYCAAPC
jgi:hypothetical protein